MLYSVIAWGDIAERSRDLMARSDLLLKLVESGLRGDAAGFRNVVAALISDERDKQHHVLADRIEATTQNASAAHNGNPAGTAALSSSSLLLSIVPRLTLDDLVLPEPVRLLCQEVVEEQLRSELLRNHNLEPRNRILLTGQPGNGKTSLAEALASALMVPLLVVRYEDVIGTYLGETSTRLAKVFAYAAARRCVLFFDEFETLGKERGDIHETGEIKRVVSSLLLQIDSLPSHVVVIAASNHPELLDRAAWRRFQVRAVLPPPAQAQIAEWLRCCEEQLGMGFGYSVRTLADKLKGSSFSDLSEFTLAVNRKVVLAGPDANIRAIVKTCLELWGERQQANQTQAV